MYKILLVIFIFPLVTLSQKYDFVWLLGYGYSLMPNDTFGITVMDFNNPSITPKIYFDKDIKFDYSGTSVCMSDKNGRYIFTTDGNGILNSKNEFMINGDDISPPDNLHSELDPQSCIVLPTSNENIYTLINYRVEIVGLSLASVQSYLSIIDMNEGNGLGKVTKKLSSFSRDTHTLSKLTATRHANGRDWWLPIPGYNTDIMYTFLIQDTIIRLVTKQKLDSIIYNGWGQAVFSPDGSYFANISSISDQQGTYIYLYRFDRCSGLFAFIKQWHINTALYHVGVAFSPNSKIFYSTFWPYIFQIDLTSNNKKIDTLGINDYFIEDIGGGFRRYNPFGFLQLGPDNRLYCVPNTESRNMHVINHPNILGQGAELKQHFIKFASLHQTLPIHPNYRLGPIDGSPCDTLGIDNIPVAEYRFDQDTGNYLKMEFTDLSYREPKEWFWNFGDPGSVKNSSSESDPIHVFSGNGLYNVCLMVKNEKGSDTICKLINIGTVGTDYKQDFLPEIVLSPNPFSDFFIVNVLDYLPQKMSIQIYTTFGELIHSQKLYHGSNFMNMDDLNPGLYFISIIENNKVIKTDKLIKI